MTPPYAFFGKTLVTMSVPLTAFLGLLVLGTFPACTPKTEKLRTREPTVIVVEARSTSGLPLSDVVVEAFVLGKGLPPAPLRVIRGEKPGTTQVFAPLLGGVQVNANCPEGSLGTRLSRTLGGAQLQSNPIWRFSLVCEPQSFLAAIGVLAPKCSEVSLTLDNEELGVTEAGVFHGVLMRNEKGVGRLKVRSLQEDCILDQSDYSLQLSSSEGMHSLRLTAQASRSPRKRSIPRKNVAITSQRPYRL